MLIFLLYAFIAYWTISLFFFIFPNILHPKKTYKSKILQAASDSFGKKLLHLSHRGGSRERLENTVEAFHNALENGTHVLEFDLQETKDGIVLVLHDAILSRLCGVDKNISDFNYNELPKVSKKILLHFSDMMRFDTSDMKNPCFPTLEEVFQKFPETIMHIDLKNNPTSVTLKVHKLIKQYHREDITIWGNVAKERSEELRLHDPSIPSFFCAKDVMNVVLCYMLGLLPFITLHHHSFSVPKYTYDFEKMKTRENNHKFDHMVTFIKFVNIISAPMYYHLKKRGILVTYWVLNHETDFEEALKHNVNGIMTDLPKTLHDFLQKKGKYLSVKEQ